MTIWMTEVSQIEPETVIGIWTLYKDGELVDIPIPFQFDNAKTLGPKEDFIDGMFYEQWAAHYSYWLSSFASINEWEKIYKAFATNDFRE